MNSKISSFKKVIQKYYKKNRRFFPWRDTTDPYHILVSEIMLQQTQTKRVVEKYLAFISKFPTVSYLAQAPLSDVLSLWQGLGYNRRAVYLKKCAETILEKHNGVVPSDTQALDELPGIGAATAASISAFAFNNPTVFIETNIRSVFIQYFFENNERVDDQDIIPLIEKTLDSKNPKEWYYALMDYGAMLKSNGTNPSRKSKHYSKQSRFEGSNRQLRGKILKLLLKKSQTIFSLTKLLKKDQKIIKKNLIQMKKEGFLLRKGTNYFFGK